MRISRGLMLAPLVAVAFTGCGGPKPPEKATLALYNFPGTAAVHVAIEKGYFKDEGLDLTVDSYDSGRLALQAALAGEADFATAADTPIARAALDGKPVAILATMCKIQRVVSIVARKDRGILSPQDLAGKRVGMAAGTTSEFFLQAYITFHNIKDVEVVAIPPERFIDALPDGDVDAIALASPHRVAVEEILGDNAVVFEDPSLYTSTMEIVTTQAFAQANPERVQRLLRALLRADRFIDDHPDEARALSLRHIEGDAALYEAEWADNKFGVALEQSLVLTLETQARWMIGTGGAAQQMPNFLDMIYSDGLRAVQRDAVTIAGK